MKKNVTFGFFAFLILVGLAGLSCQKGARHPQAEKAVRRCLVGSEKALASGMSPGSKSLLLASACKDLYVENGCRQVFDDLAATDLPQRAAVIAQACRKAYCPKLTEKKPSLCTVAKLPPSPLQLIKQWHELQWAILCRDLGPDLAASLYGKLVFARLAIQPIFVHTPLKLKVPTTLSEPVSPNQ